MTHKMVFSVAAGFRLSPDLSQPVPIQKIQLLLSPPGPQSLPLGVPRSKSTTGSILSPALHPPLSVGVSPQSPPSDSHSSEFTAEPVRRLIRVAHKVEC